MNPSPEGPSFAVPESRWRIRAAGIILVLATLAAYHGSLAEPFVFDDLPAIRDNPTLRPPWSLAALLAPPADSTVGGRPLVNLTLALNYAVGGLDVWSYHALNLLIHLGAGLVLFGIVRRTFLEFRISDCGLRKGGGGMAGVGRVAWPPKPLVNMQSPPTGEGEGWIPNPPDPDSSRSNRRVKDNAPYLPSEATFLAWVVALLWTLHPLQTEAVTYVVQRTESLMGLFYLLTLYCFIRGIRAAGANVGRGLPPSPSLRRTGPTPPVLWHALSVLCCLLGMASKEVMVSAPVLVLLYDRTFVAGTFREAWRRRKRVHLALAATWILLGVLVAGEGGNRGGTSGPGSGAPLGAYLLTQAPAVTSYLWLSFWPHPQVFDYGAQWVKDAADVFLPGVAVVVLAAGTLWALKRRPVIGFLGAWFFSILAPTSLVPGPRQTMAEHRMYLALAAVIGLAVWLAWRWGGRRTLVAGLALAAGLGWLTASRNRTYRSELALWGDTVAQVPDNRWAQCNLGMALYDRGRVTEALAHFDRGVRLAPDDPAAHNDRGMALARLGRLPEAVREYETALRLQPAFAGAHSNLGLALSEMNRPEEALRHLQTAIRLDPGLATAYFNLGNVLVRVGRLDEAIVRFKQALRLNPGDASACTNLGNALALAGRTSEAIEWFGRAVQLNPGDASAQFNLAVTLARVGRISEAIAHFQVVVRLRPDDAEALAALRQLQGPP